MKMGSSDARQVRRSGGSALFKSHSLASFLRRAPSMTAHRRKAFLDLASDPCESAKAAGLRYVNAGRPGLGKRVDVSRGKRTFAGSRNRRARAQAIQVSSPLQSGSHAFGEGRRSSGNGYARQNGSFGLTTLRNRHVQIDGRTLRFHFKGKSGVMHDMTMTVRSVCPAHFGHMIVRHPRGRKIPLTGNEGRSTKAA
jgi:hypothetical protein